jgi:PKD repeat protein
MRAAFILFLSLQGFVLNCLGQNFSPANIANLALWLRADTGITLASGAVSQWNDISGNNLHCTQTTANLRPVLSNATLINNAPCLIFDGSNDVLNGAIINGLDTSSITIFVLAKGDAVGASQTKGLFGAGTTSTGFMLAQGNGSYNLLNNGNTLNAGTGSLPLAGFPYTILSARKQYATEVKMYKNGAQLIQSTNATLCGTFTNAAYKIGVGAVYWKGEIAEIIVYKSALDTNQQKQIENYFYNRYAPPVSLGPDVVQTYSLCPVTLNAGNRFTAYLWSTGETTQSIQVKTSGSYWVRATDVFGRISFDTINITMPAVKLQQADTTICFSDTLHLYTQQVYNPNYSYLWQNMSSNSIYSATQAGSYYVKVTDTFNCYLYSDTLLLDIDSFATTVNLGNDTSLCAGNQITLQTPATNWGTLNFQWSTGSNNSFTSVFSSNKYFLTVTNSRGCVAGDSINISIVGTAPTAQFSSDTLCLGELFIPQNNSFSNDTSAIISYMWNFGNSNTSSLAQPSFLFTSVGVQPVTLTVTTSAGCSSEKTANVLVNDIPTALFQVDTMCINNPGAFTDLSSPPPSGTIVQWQWSFGDNSSSVLQNPIHQYTQSGNYNVLHVVISDNGCSDTSTANVIVLNSTTAPGVFSLLTPVNQALISGNPVPFSWQPSSSAARYNLLVSGNSNFNNPTIYNLGNVTTHFLNLPSNNTYFWKVRAYNLCNDSIETGIYSFSLLSPTDFAGLSLWLRSDTGVTLVNGGVQQWSDISGNNHHCIQNTSSARPTIANTPLINNYPSLVFDGSNDALNGVLIPGLDTSSVTVFIVTKGNAVGASQNKGIFTAGTNTTGLQIVQGNSSYNFLNNGGTLSGGSLPLTGFPYSILEAVKKYGAETRLYKNGLETGLSTNPTLCGTFTNAAYNLGISSIYYKGEIAEVIVYKSALDSISRKKIENYIYNRYAPPVNLGPDVVQTYSLCPVTLSAGNRFTAYLWSTGETSESIQVKTTGSYWVRATDVFGRISFDTVNVTMPYVGVNLTDTTICAPNSASLHVFLTGSPYTFQWNNSQNTQTASVSVTGNYVCTISDNGGCLFVSDTIHVVVDSFAFTNLLPTDTSMCSGNTISVHTSGFIPQTVAWSDGSTVPEIVVTGAGKLSVTVTDINSCVNSDSVNVTIKGVAPLVNFSAPAVCFGLSTQFTAQITVAPPDAVKSWAWSFGDGFNSTQQNPSHLYFAPGDYIATLSVVTDSGCTGSKTKTVTAAIPPIPAFNYPSIICAGTSVTLTDQTVFLFGDSIANWIWTFNGVDSITTKNAVYEFPEQGSYNVKLKAISKSGCSDTIVQKVDVFPPLMADFSFLNVCLGDSTAFVDVTPSLSVVSWQWNFGDFSLPSAQQNPKHKYNGIGNYTVSLKVENAIGCVDDVSKTISIVTKPKAQFGHLTTCEDQNYTPLDSSVVSNDSITHWKWTIGSSNYNNQAPIHYFSDTGSYNINLKVTTQKGCSDSVSKVVSVKPRPTALFSFTPLYGEAPVDVSFINQSTGASNYVWDFGDSATSTDILPYHKFEQNGVFDIRLTAVSVFGCVDSTQRTFIVAPTDLDISVDKVTVNKTQQADGSFLIEVTATVSNLGTRLITNTRFYITIGSGGVVSEEWNGLLPSGGTINVVFTANFVVAAENGNSYLCVTAVTVNNGESEKRTDNNSQCTSTNQSIQLIGPSPNPMGAEAHLGLILPKAGQVTIDIADMAGQYVVQGLQLSLPKGRSDYALPVDKMRAAEYFIRVYHNDETHLRKFVVAK